MKNRIAVLEKFGEIAFVEKEVLPLKSDEVLVEIEYVGICGSNLHMFLYGATTPPEDPNTKLVLGHECAGTVIKIGENVTQVKMGDRVVLEPGIPCGKCKYCLSGRYNLCPDVSFLDVQPDYYGAMRKFVEFPEQWLHILPADMSTLEGALVEPAAVGMHAAEVAGVKPGKKIAILGAGCIGLMTLQACRIMGASEIVVVDMIPKRLDMAEKLGAMATANSKEADAVRTVRELLGAYGADIVFETAGAKATAMMTTQMVSRGGKIMIVGTIPGETPINFLSINREVTIQTVFRYANNYPMTIEAISSGRFDVASLVTNEYAYEDVQRAFEESLSRKAEIIKGVIRVN